MSTVRWKSNSTWFVRAWRGELELPTTFFSIGLIGLTGLASMNVATGLTETAQDGEWLLWVRALPTDTRQLIEAVTLLVITICVWRSARRYDGPAIWASRARAVIVCAVIGFGALPTSVVSREFSAITGFLFSFPAEAPRSTIPAQAETAADPVLMTEPAHEQEKSAALPVTPAKAAPTKSHDRARNHR